MDLIDTCTLALATAILDFLNIILCSEPNRPTICDIYRQIIQEKAASACSPTNPRWSSTSNVAITCLSSKFIVLRFELKFFRNVGVNRSES